MLALFNNTSTISGDIADLPAMAGTLLHLLVLGVDIAAHH